MTRLLHKFAPLFAVALIAGCDDGPNQPYTPAPEGSGGKWNNGDTPGATLGGGQGFDTSYPTAGKTTLCSTDLKRQRWGWMLQQPIIPPRFYAGIDMAKSDLWEGLTIENAESKPDGNAWPDIDPNKPATAGGLCQSVPQGFIGGCPSGIGTCNSNYWGNNAEVNFEWNLGTHVVDQMVLSLGYLGSMTFKSRDGKHTYEMKIGEVPKKDGNTFLIDWNGKPTAQITELFNAAMFTFGPPAGIPWDTDSADCGADGNCLILNSGGVTIFGFRPLVIYMGGVSGVPQPALSTPTYFYNFFSKFEPYGNLPQVVKLDAEGPVASGKPRGARDDTVLCTQKIGISFGDYRKNCIEVHGPAGKPDDVDKVNLNKIKNGLTHDQEHWTANVVGVNQNFTSERAASNPDLVVLDDDKPQDMDIAQDFFFDLRAKGHVKNDYNAKDKLDLRGSALLYVEWARLLLEDANRQLKAAGAIPQNQPPKKLGDPDCTGFDANGSPNFKPGCSGIEGLIVPYWPGRSVGFAKDASCAMGGNCLNAPNNFDPLIFYGVSQIKPGDKIAAFCVDPGNFTDCYQVQSPFFSAQQWVVRMLGRGKVGTLPAEMQDRRYYYKWFAVAFVKYLKAYSNFQPLADRDNWPCSTAVDVTCKNGGLGPSDVAKQYIDMESLFFDNTGGNSFDKFEYVDRENIGKGQEGGAAEKYNFIPWDFEYGIDLLGGNQRFDNWFRRMDREEIAMYATMLTDRRHTPGQENNVNITNLFGSPVLVGALGSAVDAGGSRLPAWPSYACAIGQGGDPLSANYACYGPPPLDTSNMTACGAGVMCPAGQACVAAKTYENGVQRVCGGACDFAKYPQTGCAKANQTCVLSLDDGATEACADMLMDLNGPNAPSPHPVLYYYPSAWSRTPFAMGHSPITIHAADKRPGNGVAKITIPNFADGPYTMSPQILASPGAACAAGWTKDPSGTLCNAPLSTGTGMKAPSFSALVPWLEVQPGVGFTFPIDGQHDQAVITGQLDFTGVLETYLVDYTPWVDTVKPSCIKDGACGKGYRCDVNSRACVAEDDTVRIQAIEAEDFLGSVFACQDPLSGDILHVRQYDSALRIVNWLAAHPGGWDAVNGVVQPSAQAACQMIIRYSPYNNYIDFITSKTNGVKMSINQGAGLGRVIDVVLYDPGITQTP